MYTTIKSLWEKTKNKTEIARITLNGQFSTQAGHYPDFKVLDSKVYQAIYKDKVDLVGPYCAQLLTR